MIFPLRTNVLLLGLFIKRGANLNVPFSNTTDIDGWPLSSANSTGRSTSPQFIVMSAADVFQHPTHRVYELWQTDFTYFRVVGWGWYFLSTILDDYSRYIISWRLTTTMAACDVTDTLEDALAVTGHTEARVFITSEMSWTRKKNADQSPTPTGNPRLWVGGYHHFFLAYFRLKMIILLLLAHIV